MMEQKFYEYSQNNSGGHFDVDDKVCHRLFIEADNIQEANKKAESIGVYFNGCRDGTDCPCCGDRWYSSPEELSFPYEYGDMTLQSIEGYAQYKADTYGWTNPDGRIFYKSGYVKDIFKGKKK